jgi:lipopolysaccharide transport system permease protein
VITIGPQRSVVGIDVRELWDYRELLFFLVWRHLKVRYRQTAFGVLWAVIQPLTLMVVFTLFLGRIGGIGAAGVPYPVFALAGLVPWTLLSQAINGSSSSLLDASNLIQKVYFPRLLLPASAIAAYLVDFAIALVVLAALLAYFGVALTPAALWIIPLTILTIATALGFGLWLSALNVRYRDVRYAVPLLVQAWLFASPVAYAVDIVPTEWRPLYYLNPMAGAIEGFRWALLGHSMPPTGAVLLATIVTALVLVGGIAYFRRVERTFADVI